MKIFDQEIDGLRLLVPTLHEDARGAFRRHFCQKSLLENGIDFSVAQGNVSENRKKHTLRGLHYSHLPSNESKIISCMSGSIWNVVIDVRANSPTYLKQQIFEIDTINRVSLLVPAGCANGFLTLSDNTLVHYYMGDFYGNASDDGFRYDDPTFDIQWPHTPKVISDKDLSLPLFKRNT